MLCFEMSLREKSANQQSPFYLMRKCTYSGQHQTVHLLAGLSQIHKQTYGFYAVYISFAEEPGDTENTTFLPRTISHTKILIKLNTNTKQNAEMHTVKLQEKLDHIIV